METRSELRVLLLNPPGIQAYSRDKFCTSISQANYAWPPIDLLVFAGQMNHAYSLVFIDAIVEKLSFNDALQRVRDAQPNVIIALTSAASWPEDFAFLRQAKAFTNARIVVGGDILLAKGHAALRQYPFLDAVYLNYTAGNIQEWIAGDNSGPIDNVIYRCHNTIVVGERTEEKVFSYGVPPHELLPLDKYRFPFCRRHRYSSVITTFGCPWNCDFCVPGTFSLSLRPVQEVLQEIKYLKSIGVHEIQFQDSTFNANRDHVKSLLKAIKEHDLRIEWICQSRADCVNDDILREMAQAGCHTIQFGVESGDEQVRQGIQKKCRGDAYQRAFHLCRKHGIRPSGFFIIGLPGETEASVQRTIALSRQLRCSTAVFGIAMPHPVTALGERTQRQTSKLDEQDYYDNFTRIGKQVSELNGETILRLRLKAYRAFYLRPGYVLQRFTEIGTLYELADTIRNAIHLVRENFLQRGLKTNAPTLPELSKGPVPSLVTQQDRGAKSPPTIGLRGNGKTVGVIGGGILGMTAAYRLANEGSTVHLFEKQPFLGGLAAAAPSKNRGRVDRHHHFACGSDHFLFALLDELGCPGMTEWSDTTLSFYLSGRLLPFTSPFDLLRFPTLSLRDKFRFAKAVRWLQGQKDWKPLESVPAAEWIVEKCGERVYQVLWKHLMECKFAEAVDQVPLSWLWARLTRRASGGRLAARTERFARLRGGTHGLISLLERTLRLQGVHIHLQTPVVGLDVRGDKVAEVSTESADFQLDQVISTVANPELLNLYENWPERFTKNLQRIRYQGIVSIVVETEKRVTPDFWINIGDPDLPIPGLIDIGHLDPSERGSVIYIPHYVPCDSDYYRTDDGELARNALQWLEDVLPNFNANSVQEIHVFRDPYADPLYALNYSTLAPVHDTPLSNLQLHNTTQIYPITRSINNSVRFGVEAARHSLTLE